MIHRDLHNWRDGMIYSWNLRCQALRFNLLEPSFPHPGGIAETACDKPPGSNSCHSITPANITAAIGCSISSTLSLLGQFAIAGVQRIHIMTKTPAVAFTKRLRQPANEARRGVNRHAVTQAKELRDRNGPFQPQEKESRREH